jgi:hypothetical protein
MFATCPLLLALALAAEPVPQRGKPFQITVVDEETGRGVPLVELRTVNNLRYVTDSNGIVAFYEPGLMDQTVFFHVNSHGYEYPRDGFGFRGKALAVTEGGQAQLKIKRLNIAERLYRVTGGGIYADSLLVGARVPLRRPALNAQVFGSDSIINALYRGKLYWFWGDTNRVSYPLGNFHVPGATSALPADGGLDPERGVDLDYFLDDKGFAKPTARMPGEGPTWLGGLTVLRDAKKQERMFASYVKVKPPMTVYERGLVEFDGDKKEFKQVAVFAKGALFTPQGHPFLHPVGETEYVYFSHPFPLTRLRADPDLLARPAEYEGFTCLKEGSTVDKPEIDRHNGRARYRWRKGTPPLGPAEQRKLIQGGQLKPEEALLQLQDADTGKPVLAHGGSVYWNAYRKRWVMITVESFGSSFLGEVWYTEADMPVGPWTYARKVVTHQKYSFYNPKQHPYFDKAGGRVIFFEGTYSHTFSGNTDPTPRYDYNQVMYRLDLGDPRLVLPVPFYALGEGDRFGTIHDLPAKQDLAPAFFALDRPGKGTVPVYAAGGKDGERGLTLTPPSAAARPLFHALPAAARDVPATATPLYEFVSTDGKRRGYAIDRDWGGRVFTRKEMPLCLVWKNPLRIVLPRE